MSDLCVTPACPVGKLVSKKLISIAIGTPYLAGRQAFLRNYASPCPPYFVLRKARLDLEHSEQTLTL
jgi:hypothetical protein